MFALEISPLSVRPLVVAPIVCVPNLIVLPDNHKSFQRLVADPKSYVTSCDGTKLPAILPVILKLPVKLASLTFNLDDIVT